MTKVAKVFVDKATPSAKGYEMHWDDSVKGYGLRVSEQGKKVLQEMLEGTLPACCGQGGRCRQGFAARFA